MRPIAPFSFLVGLPLLASAERGRVVITDNNVVADNGNFLRGETHWVLQNWVGHNIYSHGPNAPGSRDSSGWEFNSFRRFGLNTIRVYASIDGLLGSRSQTVTLAKLDEIVDQAGQEGFYVVVDDHHDGNPGDETCCGTYIEAKSEDFWNLVAPRYQLFPLGGFQ